MPKIGVASPTQMGRIQLPYTIIGGVDDLLTCASDADPSSPSAATKCTPHLPDGATIQAAYIVVLCRAIQDDSGSDNYVGTAGKVQVKKSTGGTWTTGIAIPVNSLDVVASQYGAGFAVVGETDIKAQIADGSEVQFQIIDLRAAGSNILLHDLQFGVKVYYTL